VAVFAVEQLFRGKQREIRAGRSRVKRLLFLLLSRLRDVEQPRSSLVGNIGVGGLGARARYVGVGERTRHVGTHSDRIDAGEASNIAIIPDHCTVSSMLRGPWLFLSLSFSLRRPDCPRSRFRRTIASAPLSDARTGTLRLRRHSHKNMPMGSRSRFLLLSLCSQGQFAPALVDLRWAGSLR